MMKKVAKVLLAMVILFAFSVSGSFSNSAEAANYPALTPLKKLQTGTLNKQTTMYVKPDTKTKVVAKISKGKFVTITRSNKNWHFVKYGKDMVGYIPTKSVDLHSSTIKKKLGYSIQIKPIKVYSSPSVHAPAKIYGGILYEKVEYITMDGKWIAITDGVKNYYVLKKDANLKQIKGKNIGGSCLNDSLPTCTFKIDSLQAAILKVELEKILITAIAGKAFEELTAKQIEKHLAKIKVLNKSQLRKIIIKNSGTRAIPLLGAIQNVTEAIVKPDDFFNKFVAYVAAPTYLQIKNVNINNGLTIKMTKGVVTSIKTY